MGDYEVSWAYDGYRVQTLSGKESPGYGAKWKAGDVIGTAVDLDVGTVTFFQNGRSLGVAYADVRLNPDCDDDAIFACISVSFQQACRVVLQREKMKYYGQLFAQWRKGLTAHLHTPTHRYCPDDQEYGVLAVLYHKGYQCFACAKQMAHNYSLRDHTPMDIHGPLYVCTVCPNFNLCQQCCSQLKEMHEVEHQFVALPFPLPGGLPSMHQLLGNAPTGR